MASRHRSQKNRQQFSVSTQLIIKAAKQMGVKVTPLSIADNLIELTYKGKRVLAKGTVPAVNNMVSARISVSKFLTKIVLRRAKLSVPEAHLVQNLEEALSVLHRHKFPLVVKPVGGAHGYGVSVGVKNRADLSKAVSRALKINEVRHYDPGVIVEDFVSGKDYRFFVIDGRVWSVLNRVPAGVEGDGRTSVAGLIKKFNAMPQVAKAGEFTKPLIAISVDEIVRENLQEQKVSLKTVPKKGVWVYLRKTANVSLGGTSHDATDLASPALKRYAIRAAEALGLRIAGVDMAIRDISAVTPEKAGAKIIEINDSPGIDMHHYPYRGKSRPIAYGIVKAIFPTTRLPKNINIPPR